ncbi:MAG: hypothetical protein OHK0057_35460 [Thermoflexibacter sp.]
MLLIAFYLFFIVSIGENTATESMQRISVVNESVWEITSIQVSEVGKNDWSENLLSDNHWLVAGGGAVIIKTKCGIYDVKLIDTDKHQCIIKQIDICGNSQSLLITDKNISPCLFN